MNDEMKKFIQEDVEDFLYEVAGRSLDRAGCDYGVKVDDDLVPSIWINSYDDGLSVEVTTNIMDSRDGEIEYEFVGTVSVNLNQASVSLYYEDMLSERFTRWTEIACALENLYSEECVVSFE